MTKNHREIKFLRTQIPPFICKPGCHDCCGPVTASSEEMAELPVKTKAEHDDALKELTCPHLGNNGCAVYHDRPLICRLFGTTPKLACPHGIEPETQVSPEIEQRIYRFNKNTRQVLV